MRPWFWLFISLIGTAGLYHLIPSDKGSALVHTEKLAEPTGSPPNFSSKPNAEKRNNHVKSTTRSNEEANVGTDSKDELNASLSPVSGAPASKTSQSESLYSIYPNPVVPIGTDGKSSKDVVVHGVPIHAWAQSGQPTLSPAPIAKTPAPLKVYVQCVDAGQMEALSTRRCREIIANGREERWRRMY